MKYFKIGSLASLGLYGLWGAFHIQSLWLIDGANLLFHEAGHLIFGLFGEYIGVWGGTLMQLLVPGAVAAGFYYKNDFYAASVMTLWLGENFFGISKYISDARTGVLPLIGNGDHDWTYLLGHAHLLNHDQFIGSVVWVLGLLIVLGSAGLGIFYELKKS